MVATPPGPQATKQCRRIRFHGQSQGGNHGWVCNEGWGGSMRLFCRVVLALVPCLLTVSPVGAMPATPVALDGTVHGFRNDPAHTGVFASATPGQHVKLFWRYQARQAFFSSAVATDGTVYAA